MVGAVVPAVEPASWPKTLACASGGGRYAAIGVHPQYLPGLTERAIDEAMGGLVPPSCGRWARASSRSGECGFDGSTAAFRAGAPWQRRVFSAHVEAARALDLPLVVHVLQAHGAALDAMRAVALPRRPGVVHSFSGSAELAREYVALGWHLAMGGACDAPERAAPAGGHARHPRGGAHPDRDRRARPDAHRRRPGRAALRAGPPRPHRPARRRGARGALSLPRRGRRPTRGRSSGCDGAVSAGGARCRGRGSELGAGGARLALAALDEVDHRAARVGREGHRRQDRRAREPEPLDGGAADQLAEPTRCWLRSAVTLVVRTHPEPFIMVARTS